MKKLVGEILDAVVGAIPEHAGHAEIPHRLEPGQQERPTIARIAESAGIRAVAIHGRTRCQQYTGEAEYDTIAMVKTLDEDSGHRQRRHHDAGKGQARARRDRRRRVMIGRAAQGRPGCSARSSIT